MITCTECKQPLHRRTKSGKCRRCYDASRRTPCGGCGRPLSKPSGVRTGLCRACYYEKLGQDSTRPTCAVCTVRLDRRNTSGLCAKCYKAKYQSTSLLSALTLGLRNQNWMDDAACGNSDNPDAWWPSDTATRAEIAEALAVCADCPVRSQCLAFSIANKEKYGIWGGKVYHRSAGRPGRPRKAA